MMMKKRTRTKTTRDFTKTKNEINKNMGNFLFILANNIVALAAVIGATIMAVNRIDGWGWLLLVAVICHTSYYIRNNEVTHDE